MCFTLLRFIRRNTNELSGSPIVYTKSPKNAIGSSSICSDPSCQHGLFVSPSSYSCPSGGSVGKHASGSTEKRAVSSYVTRSATIIPDTSVGRCAFQLALSRPRNSALNTSFPSYTSSSTPTINSGMVSLT